METALIPTVATPPALSSAWEALEQTVQLPQPPARPVLHPDVAAACSLVDASTRTGDMATLRRASFALVRAAQAQAAEHATAQRRQGELLERARAEAAAAQGKWDAERHSLQAEITQLRTRLTAARLDAEVCRDGLTAAQAESARLSEQLAAWASGVHAAGDEAAAAREAAAESRRWAQTQADVAREQAKQRRELGEALDHSNAQLIETRTMLRAVEADLLVARAEAASARRVAEERTNALRALQPSLVTTTHAT